MTMGKTAVEDSCRATGRAIAVGTLNRMLKFG
jgi:hypothetical protein